MHDLPGDVLPAAGGGWGQPGGDGGGGGAGDHGGGEEGGRENMTIEDGFEMKNGKGRVFTHIAVEKDVQLKLKIMAPVMQRRMYDLVREWVEDAWEELVQAGLVSDKSDSSDSSDPG